MKTDYINRGKPNKNSPPEPSIGKFKNWKSKNMRHIDFDFAKLFPQWKSESMISRVYFWISKGEPYKTIIDDILSAWKEMDTLTDDELQAMVSTTFITVLLQRCMRKL